MSQHNLFDDDDDGMLVHPIVNNRSSSTVPQVVLQSIETSIGPNQLRVKKETLSLFEEDEEGIDELVALRLTASASSGRLNKAIIPDSLFDGEDDIHGNDSNTKSNNNLQFDLSSTKISQVAQLRGSLFDDEEEVVSLARGGGSGPTVAPKIPHTTGVVSASKNLFADDDEESVFESKYYEERARRIQLESKVAELQSKLALLENKLFKYEPDFDWKGLQVPSSSIQSPSMSSRKSVRLSVRGVRDIFAGSSPVQDAAVARPGPSDNTTDEGGEGVNNNSPSAVENDECGTEGVDISGGGGGGSSQGVSEAAMRRQRRYAATVGAKTARRRNLRTASTRTTPSNIVDSSSSNNEEALEDESPVAESATYAHTEGGGSADRNSVSLESYSDAEQTESKCKLYLYAEYISFYHFCIHFMPKMLPLTRWIPR